MYEDIKFYAALGAVLLTIPTTLIYFGSIRRGETKPHVLTWAVLATITLSTAIVQYSAGARWGVTPLLFAALAGYIFAYMAWCRGYTGSITAIDWLCIACSAAAWIVWIEAGQPSTAIIALTTASVMAFLPTLRKSWNQPWDEPISSHVLNIFRYALASIAVANYSLATGLYPGVWAGINATVVILLITRRYISLTNQGELYGKE